MDEDLDGLLALEEELYAEQQRQIEDAFDEDLDDAENAAPTAAAGSRALAAGVAAKRAASAAGAGGRASAGADSLSKRARGAGSAAAPSLGADGSWWPNTQDFEPDEDEVRGGRAAESVSRREWGGRTQEDLALADEEEEEEEEVAGGRGAGTVAGGGGGDSTAHRKRSAAESGADDAAAGAEGGGDSAVLDAGGAPLPPPEDAAAAAAHARLAARAALARLQAEQRVPRRLRPGELEALAGEGGAGGAGSPASLVAADQAWAFARERVERGEDDGAYVTAPGGRTRVYCRKEVDVGRAGGAGEGRGPGGRAGGAGEGQGWGARGAGAEGGDALGLYARAAAIAAREGGGGGRWAASATRPAAAPLSAPGAATAGTPLPPARSGRAAPVLPWSMAHAPRGFLGLLSDERVNRELAAWLQTWSRACAPGAARGGDEGAAEDRARPAAALPYGSTANPLAPWARDPADPAGRPRSRVCLLLGPPGAGKSTLARVAAEHCGFKAVEVDASDCRAAGRLGRTVAERAAPGGTLEADTRPRCVVVEEVDGALGGDRGAAKALLDVVLGKDTGAKRAAGADRDRKGEPSSSARGLSRPVLCIANDAQAPAVRELARHALVLRVRAPEPERLARRLRAVLAAERVRAAPADLAALAERANGDVRACLGALQFSAAKRRREVAGVRADERGADAKAAAVAAGGGARERKARPVVLRRADLEAAPLAAEEAKAGPREAWAKLFASAKGRAAGARADVARREAGDAGAAARRAAGDPEPAGTSCVSGAAVEAAAFLGALREEQERARREAGPGPDRPASADPAATRLGWDGDAEAARPGRGHDAEPTHLARGDDLETTHRVPRKGSPSPDDPLAPPPVPALRAPPRALAPSTLRARALAGEWTRSCLDLVAEDPDTVLEATHARLAELVGAGAAGVGGAPGAGGALGAGLLATAADLLSQADAMGAFGGAGYGAGRGGSDAAPGPPVAAPSSASASAPSPASLSLLASAPTIAALPPPTSRGSRRADARPPCESLRAAAMTRLVALAGALEVARTPAYRHPAGARRRAQLAGRQQLTLRRWRCRSAFAASLAPTALVADVLPRLPLLVCPPVRAAPVRLLADREVASLEGAADALSLVGLLPSQRDDDEEERGDGAAALGGGRLAALNRAAVPVASLAASANSTASAVLQALAVPPCFFARAPGAFSDRLRALGPDLAPSGPGEAWPEPGAPGPLTSALAGAAAVETAKGRVCAGASVVDEGNAVPGGPGAFDAALEGPQWPPCPGRPAFEPPVHHLLEWALRGVTVGRGAAKVQWWAGMGGRGCGGGDREAPEARPTFVPAPLCVPPLPGPARQFVAQRIAADAARRVAERSVERERSRTRVRSDAEGIVAGAASGAAPHASPLPPGSGAAPHASPPPPGSGAAPHASPPPLHLQLTLEDRIRASTAAQAARKAELGAGEKGRDGAGGCGGTEGGAAQDDAKGGPGRKKGAAGGNWLAAFGRKVAQHGAAKGRRPGGAPKAERGDGDADSGSHPSVSPGKAREAATAEADPAARLWAIRQAASYTFHEGYTNAVRRPLRLDELL